MSDFGSALGFTLVNEGHFTHDVNSPVNYGLGISDVAKYRGRLESEITEDDIRNLQLDEVKAIYKEYYWDALKLDQIKDQGIATAIFDTGVNQGLDRSVRFAQATCVASGLDMVIDGYMGPLTISNINNIGRDLFINKFKTLVENRYQSLVKTNPDKYGKFLIGWLARAHRLSILV